MKSKYKCTGVSSCRGVKNSLYVVRDKKLEMHLSVQVLQSCSSRLLHQLGPDTVYSFFFNCLHTNV